jgi:hypothetical protein
VGVGNDASGKTTVMFSWFSISVLPAVTGSIIWLKNVFRMA